MSSFTLVSSDLPLIRLIVLMVNVSADIGDKAHTTAPITMFMMWIFIANVKFAYPLPRKNDAAEDYA